MAIELGTVERLGSIWGMGLGELTERLAPENVVPYFSELGTDFPFSLSSEPAFVGSLSGTVEEATTLRPLLEQLATAQPAITIIRARLIKLSRFPRS